MRSWAIWLLCAGCFYDESSPLPQDFATCAATDDGTAGVQAPTWYRDVEPIVVTKCQGCHTDDGIAPFALDGYNAMVAQRGVIRDAIDTRTMPPWQPGACCNTYRYDRSLSDDERDTLLRWFDAGLPYGDPADEQPVTPPVLALPRVDLTATMRVPFVPQPKLGADELRCFLLDHDPIETTRYITGFNFKPGVRGEVHHAIVMALDESHLAEIEAKDGADGRPGWDCWGQGSELTADTTYIGGWQPGELPRLLPDGIGRELPAHTRIVIQIHYDTGHGIAPDLSSLEMMLADHVDRIEKGAAVGNPLWFVGDGMEIPANAPDTMVWAEYDPTIWTKGKPLEIHNVMLHMHELGSLGRVAIIHPDGSTVCLLNIPKWNFHWMADYYFADPVVLNPGDKLYVECHWDNTAAHQKVVNGVQQTPRTLHWGTDEEMCGAVVTYAEALQ